MSAITLGWIYGEMFDIVEFAEIPVGNKTYRSIMMEQLITAAFPPEEHRPLEELRLYTDSRPHFYNNIILYKNQ